MVGTARQLKSFDIVDMLGANRSSGSVVDCWFFQLYGGWDGPERK